MSDALIPFTKLVSDYYLVTRMGDFPVAPDEAKNIITIWNAGNKGAVELRNGSFISIDQIQGILTKSDYNEHRQKRAGNFKCKWGFWHGQREQCAHGQIAEPERKRLLERQNNA